MMKTVLSISFFVFVVAAAVLLELHFNFDPAKAGLIATGFMVLAMAMQYAVPQQRKALERRELLTDVLYFIFGTVVFGALSNMAIQAVTRWLAPGLLVKSGIIAAGEGVARLPFVPQVLLFMLLVDIGYYWTHRLAHSWPLLFRFHSIHHMPHRVSVLNGARAHPLDSFWRRGVPTILVLQAGFDKDVVGMGMLLMMLIGIIQHMNVNFDFGWLNRIIGTNQAHRWHHSTVVDEARNYGLLSIWDQVWGSYYLPADRVGPQAMGLEDQGTAPVHSFFYQLLLPFLPGQKAASAPDLPAQADRA